MIHEGDAPTEFELESLRAVYEHGTIQKAAKAIHRPIRTIRSHLERLRIKLDEHYLHRVMVAADRKGWLGGER
jgi:molybdenum-dependent DNA-binding transcriptional regulator ModE